MSPNINKTEDFVRIVNSNNKHWVCIVGGLCFDREDVI
jgi:hypothetical protein